MSTTTTGIAQIAEIPVRQRLENNAADPNGRKMIVTLDPPLEGDDNQMHHMGVALQTGRAIDVYAMDADRPGFILEDSEGFWVSLINGLMLSGPHTIEGVLRHHGYGLVMS